MPQINNIEQLRRWFLGCGAIERTNVFNVDYTGENPTQYAIYSMPSTIAYHENVLGEEVPDAVQQINYTFAAKEDYGRDIRQNMENLGWFQDVCEWILTQNSNRNFPQIREGKVQSIVPTLTAYPAEVGSDAAKYQIQIRITYKRY